MTNEETIFAAALARDSATSRAAYLDDACAGNDELRRSVEALLRAHERPAGILESPPAGGGSTAATPSPSERIGSTVGPYKLLEQIGGGGMGVVYMAEQVHPIRRKVALKIIKPGMDSGQVIARFEAERQALTMMDHPNIAKVLDAGTTDAGRPYFAMELVKGVPITDYCDQAWLTTRERLELFIPVCQAVQHAHQKGIIHRDLKPTNVLVTLHDDKPVPKVIDFGIAKATGQQLTERTLFTNYAQMVGTPLYMSPEQAQISGVDVDTRSDVYSLGVLLYELLTGTTPFDKQRMRDAAYDEMRRIIREEEPPKPSTRLNTLGEQLTAISAHRHTEPKTLGQLVRGELDWIVMKALEKERGRRYETATGLGSDVQRYLNDEAVLACPPTAIYRLRKLTSRYRVPLMIIVGFVVLLMLATAISGWQAIRAMRAEALAQSRLESETLAGARAAAEAVKAATISELLQEMLRSANPNQGKGADYTVRQLLDESSSKLSDQLKGQPEVEAAIRATIGVAYRGLGAPEKAEPHLRTALALNRAAFGPDSVQLAESLVDFGWTRQEFNNSEAEASARDAIRIYKARGAGTHPIIKAMHLLEHCLLMQGKGDEAEAVATAAIALCESNNAEYPELASILQRLADVKAGRQQFAEAENLARRAVEMHRRLRGDAHPQTAWGLLSHANVLRALNRNADAEPAYRESLSIFRRYYDEDHRSIKYVFGGLVALLSAEGDQAGLAALQAEKALRLNNALERETDGLTVRMQLVDFLRDAGDLERALANLTAAAERATATNPAQKYGVAEKCSQLARLLRDKGSLQPAERAFRIAIKLREPADDAPPGTRLAQAIDHNDLGFLDLPRRLPEAEEAVRKGLALKQRLVAESHENLDYQFHLAHSYIGLGYILQQKGRGPEAAQAINEAHVILTKLATDASSTPGLRTAVGHTLRQLSNAWRQLDRLENAEQADQQALKALQPPASQKQ